MRLDTAGVADGTSGADGTPGCPIDPTNQEDGLLMMHPFFGDDAEDLPTRRTMLRRIGAAGMMATAGAGVAQLIGSSSARAASGGPLTNLGPMPTVIQSAEPILSAMDPASAAIIRQQMAATPDCQVCFYVEEGHCDTSHCPDNGCCYYHTGCGGYGLDCIPNYSCAHGNYCT